MLDVLAKNPLGQSVQFIDPGSSAYVPGAQDLQAVRLSWSEKNPEEHSGQPVAADNENVPGSQLVQLVLPDTSLKNPAGQDKQCVTPVVLL